MRKIIFLLLVCLLLAGCGTAKQDSSAAAERTILGTERIDEPEYSKLLQGKALGLFTNQSGVNGNLELTADRLDQRYDLKAIYVPEHGFYSAVRAGKKIQNSTYNNLPIYSLYGDNRRPTPSMLEDIDAMVVDIQDVGTRHYTYFSTLAYIMEECAKLNKEVIILDRPNPLGGTVQGPVLKPEYATFIGLYSIPLRHGLTIGEYAKYINQEEHINCKLQVIPMKNWKRSMLWQDTGLEWVQPSPLIPTSETAILYGVTGICGDTNMAVGVGTAKPFHFVGAEYANAHQLKEALDSLGLEGVRFRSASFIPRYGKNKDKCIQGVEIYITNPKTVNLPELEYTIASTVMSLYPSNVEFTKRGYKQPGYKADIALGEDSLRQGEAPQQAFARWQKECTEFQKKAQPYLLYK